MSHLLLADFGLFVGRFHPLIVHLPIGFLLLAAFLEWWPGERVRSAITASWVLGAGSAAAAAGAGWLLAAESGGGDTLFWHRWLGISVMVLALVGVVLVRRGGKLAKGYGLLVVALLGLTGHQGGNLTHGEEYLFQYAPPVVQRLSGHLPDSVAMADWARVNTDSINLYAAFIQPALEEKCVRCHNAEKQNGGLRMDQPHFVFAGGEGGKIISAGNPFASHWLERVTLPEHNPKSMPPRGEPWSYAQVELLNYWIAEGADTLFVFDPKTTPDGIKTLLQRDYGLDLRPRMFVETVMAPALGSREMAELEEMHWSLSSLQPGGGALEAKPKPGSSIEPAALAKLAELAPDQVAYLSLDRLPFDDADLAPLTKFTNLNRLRLNGTRVSVATLGEIKQLPHLESLNLYGTEVDDRIFAELVEFPGLKRLYLWQTQVTEAAVTAFSAKKPDVAVDMGYKPTSPTSTPSK